MVRRLSRGGRRLDVVVTARCGATQVRLKLRLQFQLSGGVGDIGVKGGAIRIKHKVEV